MVRTGPSSSENKLQAPTTKLQRSSKHQKPTCSGTSAARLELGIWSFPEVWWLELDASALNAPAENASPPKLGTSYQYHHAQTSNAQFPLTPALSLGERENC